MWTTIRHFIATENSVKLLTVIKLLIKQKCNLTEIYCTKIIMSGTGGYLKLVNKPRSATRSHPFHNERAQAREGWRLWKFSQRHPATRSVQKAAKHREQGNSVCVTSARTWDHLSFWGSPKSQRYFHTTAIHARKTDAHTAWSHSSSLAGLQGVVALLQQVPPRPQAARVLRAASRQRLHLCRHGACGLQDAAQREGSLRAGRQIES